MTDTPRTPASRRRSLKLLSALGSLALVTAALALSRTLPTAEPRAAAQGDDVPAHTAKAVAAAEKFLQSLDDKLRTKATFDFTSPKRPQWSNLPVGMVPRNGVRMGELTRDQREAALAVVASVTSADGYQKILDIIGGDDVLAKGGGKGGKGKGKGGDFGFDNFYLAIFGKPSAKEPWLVQFGGHHLAVNITVIGKDFVLTPTLTCAQPFAYDRDGKKVRPLGVEVDTAFKLLGTLNDKQKAQAVVSNKSADLVLGPGKDGKDIKAEGLKGSDMDENQQKLLAELAAAWVLILHESSAKPRMDDIRAGIKDTYFAWFGPTAEGSPAYFRVTGPTVVIEYAPQGTTDHIHTIIREPGNDYGKKLLKK